MRLNYSKKTSTRVKARLKNKARIRKKVNGTAERPRLCVYRSLKNISAQIVDDVTGNTLVSVSTVKQGKNNRDICKEAGAEIAKKAMAKNIEAVVFDRGGFVYHGKIKAFADGAREAGLKF